MPKIEVTQFDALRRVRVGDVLLPPRFTIRFYEDEYGGPDVEHVWEVRDGVPQCREVHITATEGGHEVRVSGLAKIRVEDVLEKAILEMTLGTVTRRGQHFHISPDAGAPEQRNALRGVRESRRALKVRVTYAMLQRVAEVYRANVEDRPTEAVADAFQTTHRTAGRYVQRARNAHLLGPAIRGRAGER